MSTQNENESEAQQSSQKTLYSKFTHSTTTILSKVKCFLLPVTNVLPGFMQGLEFIVLLSNFIIMIISFGLLIYFILAYLELGHQSHTLSVEWTIKPQMSPIYYAIGLWSLALITTIAGCIGSCYQSTACIKLYIFMVWSCVVTMLVIPISRDVFGVTTINTVVNHFFEQFEQYHYGNEGVMKIMSSLLEDIHTVHSCCGFYNYDRVLHNRVAQEQLQVVYWTDSTHWGQIQASKKHFKRDAHIPWVPNSCCKDPNICNTDRFQYDDRLQWNSILANFWKDMVYIDSCRDKVLDWTTVPVARLPSVLLTMLCVFVLLVIVGIGSFVYHWEIGRVNAAKLRQEDRSSEGETSTQKFSKESLKTMSLKSRLLSTTNKMFMNVKERCINLFNDIKAKYTKSVKVPSQSQFTDDNPAAP